MEYKTEKKRKEPAPSKEDLLEAIMNLNENCNQISIDQDSFWDFFGFEAKIISDFLSIENIQSLFFSVILDESLRTGSCSWTHLAARLGFEPFELVLHHEALDNLERVGLLMKDGETYDDKLSYGDVRYFVPDVVFQAIREADNALIPQPNEDMNTLGLIQQINKTLMNYKLYFIDHFNFAQEVDVHLFRYRETKFSKGCEKFKFRIPEIVILTLLFDSWYQGREEESMDDITSGIFFSPLMELEYKRGLLTGENDLIAANFITVDNSSWRTEKVLRLTEIAFLECIEKEFSIIKADGIDYPNLTQHKDIKPKELKFNKSEQFQLEQIASFLNKTKLLKIQKRLQKRDLAKGITCLLYGVSGCGKTQFVK